MSSAAAATTDAAVASSLTLLVDPTMRTILSLVCAIDALLLTMVARRRIDAVLAARVHVAMCVCWSVFLASLMSAGDAASFAAATVAPALVYVLAEYTALIQGCVGIIATFEGDLAAAISDQRKKAY